MLPRTVRGVVEAAAVVVEEVGKRVVGTAATILERTGVDVAEVERRLGGQFPPSAKQLQALAEEAVTAGRAGVDLAVGVARGEVEKAFEKVGDQVTKVGVVLAYLESKLREVEEDAVPARSAAGARDEEPAPAPRADGLFGRGWEQQDEPPVARAGEPVAAERVEVDEPVEVDPPVAPAGRAPAVKSASEPVEGAAAGETAAADETGAKRAPAKKTAAKKTAAKKAPAKKTAVKKTATAKSTAKKTAAADAPAKRTATKKTTVRKATSTKKPDA